MNFIAISLGIAMIASVAPMGSPEEEAAAAAAAEATAEARGDNAYVCKKFPPKTGSRLGRERQICMTRQEWEARDEEMATILRDHQRQGLQTKPDGQ